jgi:hypothetical protein
VARRRQHRQRGGGPRSLASRPSARPRVPLTTCSQPRSRTRKVSRTCRPRPGTTVRKPAAPSLNVSVGSYSEAPDPPLCTVFLMIIWKTTGQRKNQRLSRHIRTCS